MAAVGIGDLRQLSVGHMLKLERRLVPTREPVPAAVAPEEGAVTTTPTGTDPTTLPVSPRDVAVTRATSFVAVSTKAVAEVVVTVKKRPRISCTTVFLLIAVPLGAVYLDAFIQQRACFFLKPPYKKYSIAPTDPSACDNIVPNFPVEQPLDPSFPNSYPTTTYNVVLFGDSMIAYSFESHNLTGRIKSFLPQYANNLNFFNEGRPDTFISEHVARLNGSIAHVYQQLVQQGRPRRIDAFLVFWDTDTSNTVWCGTTGTERAGILKAYKANVVALMTQVRATIPNVFLALGSPWTQGEGFNKCNHDLAEYDYKIGIYDVYTSVNKQLAESMVPPVPFMDFRAAWKALKPAAWNDYLGCLTVDGEHQNDKGTQVIGKIFASTLLSWLKKVKY